MKAPTPPPAARERPGRTRQFTEWDFRRLGPVRRYFSHHPRVLDWALAVILLLLGILFTAGLQSSEINPTGRTVSYTVAVVAGVALLWRRRFPLTILAIQFALAIVNVLVCGQAGFQDLIVAFSLYAVAASRPASQAWMAFTAVCLGIPLAYWPVVHRQSITPLGAGAGWTPAAQGASTSETFAAIVVQIGFFGVIAMAIGTSVRSRRQHVASLVTTANDLARDRDQQGQIATAAERARIAREMHDVVAHSLTVVVTLAEGARKALRRDPDLAESALTELSATGREALADMRQLLGVLREDAQTEDAPLAPADSETTVDELIARFRTTGLHIRIIREGELESMDGRIRHVVSRIVQESLTNVLRYAPRTPLVRVEIRRVEDDGGSIVVAVTNQAPREDMTPADRGHVARSDQVPLVGTGRGIVGLRERVSMQGGTLTAGTTEDGGWSVRARIPLSRPSRDAGVTL